MLGAKVEMSTFIDVREVVAEAHYGFEDCGSVRAISG